PAGEPAALRQGACMVGMTSEAFVKDGAGLAGLALEVEGLAQLHQYLRLVGKTPAQMLEMGQRLFPLAEAQQGGRQPQPGLVVLGIEIEQTPIGPQGLAALLAQFFESAAGEQGEGAFGLVPQPAVDGQAGLMQAETIKQTG